jgi:hypothetical protein
VVKTAMNIQCMLIMRQQDKPRVCHTSRYRYYITSVVRNEHKSHISKKGVFWDVMPCGSKALNPRRHHSSVTTVKTSNLTSQISFSSFQRRAVNCTSVNSEYDHCSHLKTLQKVELISVLMRPYGNCLCCSSHLLPLFTFDFRVHPHSTGVY